MPDLTLPNGYYDLPPGKLANLVTCLEMVLPPDRMAGPLGQGQSFKRFGPENVQEFRTLFKAVGQDLMWFSRLVMPEARLAELLSDPDIESFALFQDGRAVGLLELNFTQPKQAELAFFGLVPDAVGLGLGRVLMREALRIAWARPIERLWVHTCHFDHPAALSFYQKSGFRPFKLMVEVHDDPRLTGHLPLTAAPQVPLLKT